MSDFERRLTAMPVEARSTSQRPRVIQGYAAVFERRSQPLAAPGYREVVETVGRSFFNKSRGDGWPHVVARQDHQPNMLLGTVRSGTLELNVDNTGLFYSVDVPQTRMDTWELVERRDIVGSSFEFKVFEDDWGFDGSVAQRHLISGQLIDVGPTATPAYLDSTAEVLARSLSHHRDVPVDDVLALMQRGELRSLFTRTDLAVAAPPTVEPHTEEDNGMDPHEALRILEERLAPGMDWREAWLQLKKREIDADVVTIANLPARNYITADQAAAHREEQAKLLALATQRRLNALAQEGKTIPAAGVGNTWTHHGPAGNPVLTPRQAPRNDGWVA